MYSNNIVNFQESTTILKAHTKKVWKLIVCTSYLQHVPELEFLMFKLEFFKIILAQQITKIIVKIWLWFLNFKELALQSLQWLKYLTLTPYR